MVREVPVLVLRAPGSTGDGGKGIGGSLQRERDAESPWARLTAAQQSSQPRPNSTTPERDTPFPWKSREDEGPDTRASQLTVYWCPGDVVINDNLGA